MMGGVHAPMARIELADRDDLPPENRDLLASLSAKEGLPEEYHHLIENPDRDVYRAIARAPDLLEPFRTYAQKVWECCGASARKRELVILTVARELEAEYEWHQHVRVGLKAGLTPMEIRGINLGDYTELSDDDRILIRYIQSYVQQNVDDGTFTAFVRTYDEPTVVGVSLLGGIYVTIALFGDALELETEEPFVGWDLSGL